MLLRDVLKMLKYQKSVDDSIRKLLKELFQYYDEGELQQYEDMLLKDVLTSQESVDDGKRKLLEKLFQYYDGDELQ